MTILHLESFGSMKHYPQLIFLVGRNKHHWRKCANILNTVRRNLRPWPMVDPGNQRREAAKYARQALRDVRMPETVKAALATGMTSEFRFKFE